VEDAVRKLSQRQDAILSFIDLYVDEHGYPPSIREIGAAAGISSTSVVDYNLRILEREGLLHRDREVSRGLGLTTTSERPSARSRVVRVPLVGRIAAGQPIEAVEGEHETLEFSAGLISEDCYALQVKGKSMIEDLIDDGDIVVVRPQETAENGEIVVALLPGEGGSGAATLKRFYRERDQIRLQPANASMQPIYVRPDELMLQGKVVALFRQL
jgi:repressor LexA